ncbi:hypothetical protein C100_11365 [Sphingobium sp. C100]|nr:hypothetical protein C100_11365 [Sphingobium sp. C100]
MDDRHDAPDRQAFRDLEPQPGHVKIPFFKAT